MTTIEQDDDLFPGVSPATRAAVEAFLLTATARERQVFFAGMAASEFVNKHDELDNPEAFEFAIRGLLSGAIATQLTRDGAPLTTVLDEAKPVPPGRRRGLTIGWREDSRAGGHVTVSVFAGYNPDARGRTGTLTFRIDEWEELQTDLSLMDRNEDACDDCGRKDFMDLIPPLNLSLIDDDPRAARAVRLVGWGDDKTWHIANGGHTMCDLGYASDAEGVEFLTKTSGELDREGFEVCWPCQVKWHELNP